MKQRFEDDQKVQIKSQADFKYNNRRFGSVGRINDIYISEKYGEFVYEVEFNDRVGYELIHQDDLEKA